MTAAKKIKDPKTASTEIVGPPAPPEPARVPAGISCAICLNKKGDRVQAVTIVKGYACCANHVDIVARPNFDIFQLRTSKGFT